MPSEALADPEVAGARSLPTDYSLIAASRRSRGVRQEVERLPGVDERMRRQATFGTPGVQLAPPRMTLMRVPVTAFLPALPGPLGRKRSRRQALLTPSLSEEHNGE